MKLFTYDAAPNPRRVNLFMACKGIRLPTQQVDLRKNEHLGAEYRAICPRCIVPALQLDDGTVLCDGIAICWYLERIHPDKPLLGVDPVRQAEVLSWDHYIFGDGIQAVAEALRNGHPAFKDRALTGPDPVPQIPQLEARGRQRLAAFWRHLEEHLRGRSFIVGDSMTLADIDAFVLAGFAGWIKERVPETLPQLREWHRRIEESLPQSA